MKKKKKKVYDDDDGRVIAPMNVDGMPWYDDRQPKGTSLSDGSEDFNFKELSPEEKKEYRRETRGLIFGIMKYVVPIMLVFIVAFFLLIFAMTR